MTMEVSNWSHCHASVHGKAAPGAIDFPPPGIVIIITNVGIVHRPAHKRKIAPMKWDAGHIGCGQLVFELSRRVKEMKPGERLEITAHDPGASTDLPAWCRMTGNTLVSADHPVYVIERRED